MDRRSTVQWCAILFFAFLCYFSWLHAESWMRCHDGWSHPVKEGKVCPTYVLFAPGWFQNETAVVRYCGSMVLPGGVCVQWPVDFCTIHPQFVYSVRFSEFSDDVPHDLFGWAGYALLRAVRVLRNFVEGICTRPSDALCPRVHHHLNSPAGQKDVQLLAQAYEGLCRQIPQDSDIVLYGFSRGATAALIFLATQYQVWRDKRIRAVVLEAPFVGVEQLLLALFPRLYRLFGQEKLQALIRSMFNDGADALLLNSPMQLDSTLPLLFVTSACDEIVPCNQVQQLYDRLSIRGCDNALLYLDNSFHTRYMLTNAHDTQRYYRTVHQWYRSHGCSHHAEALTDNCHANRKSPISAQLNLLRLP